MCDQTPEEIKKRLAELIQEQALFKEKIILSSGKESDYYIDARRLTLNSEGAAVSARAIYDLVKDETFDAIGGPTLGADPILGALGVVFYKHGKKVNSFIIRKEAKGHGKKKQIEGPDLPKGSEVIVIDDVATTGKAFIHSIDVLTEHGIKVKKVVCLVDRDEGAKEAVAEKGCELVSIFKGPDFLK